jgi:hypothetical protein
MSEGNEQNTTRSGNGIYIIIILLLLVGLGVMANVQMTIPCSRQTWLG